MDDERFLNVEQARRYLELPRTTFARWRRSGIVVDKGRWTREELDAIVVPPKKPRGRHAKKPAAADETASASAESSPPLPPEDAAPSSSPPTSPPTSSAPSSFNPADPYKANLPQKRAKPGQNGAKPVKPGQNGASQNGGAAKLDGLDEEGFHKGPPGPNPGPGDDWEKAEGLWS